MKVILLENVRKIGSIGEIIDVKRGFARNYLISFKGCINEGFTSILSDKLMILDISVGFIDP